MINKKQKGFTLIELMIALTLGLLVIAAGMALFINSQRSTILQNSMSELQQNSNFGLAVFAQDLRHTNLNTLSTQRVNNKLVGSGIIFGPQNLPSSLVDIDASIFTRQNNNEGATTTQSDQLTIQYIPEYSKVINTSEVGPGETPVVTESYVFNGVDCEGNVLNFNKITTIVQRYHLLPEPDSHQVAGAPTSYSLYCDAGYYADGDTTITGIDSNSKGQQIMQKIDAFKLRLWVKEPASIANPKVRYMTINEYLALMPAAVEATQPKTHYNVHGAEIGIIARSSASINDSLINNNRTFDVVGNTLTLESGRTGVNSPKYLSEVLTQFVAFRNTMGASE